MTAGGRRTLVWLGQAVTRADDAALGRVVALLDGLKDRGDADELLARARHRLHALRPPRPLAFTRLLFVPLDGVIVPAAKWRRGEGQLPRSALPVLADAVHAALGAEGEAIAAACRDRIMADADAVERVGRRLWPAAARVLPASAPPDWEAAGLLAADYTEIAALCRPLWAAGPVLQSALATAAAEQAPRKQISAALHALAEAGPVAFAAGLATLMESTALPGQVAQVAAGIAPGFRSIAVRQAEAALDRKGPEFDLLEPQAAGAAALSLAIRFDDLEASGLLDLAARRRLHALRRGAEDACRDSFLASVERQVLAPLAALIEAPEVADETIAAIEAEARALARLECAGRRLREGGGAYDRARRAIAEALRLLAGRALGPAGLRPMDLARIAEILSGTEEAAALLARYGAAAIAGEAQPAFPTGTPAGSALPAR